jgi:hypothetical protein
LIQAIHDPLFSQWKVSASSILLPPFFCKLLRGTFIGNLHLELGTLFLHTYRLELCTYVKGNLHEAIDSWVVLRHVQIRSYPVCVMAVARCSTTRSYLKTTVHVKRPYMRYLTTHLCAKARHVTCSGH